MRSDAYLRETEVFEICRFQRRRRERERERQREGFVLCQIDSEASLMSNNTAERGEEELEYCFHFLFGANLSPFYFG